MLTAVRSVGVYAGDQDRSKKFFTETLGFELVQDTPMGDGPGAPRWIEVAPPVLELPHRALQRPPQLLALGVPERRAGADVVEAEQVEGHAEAHGSVSDPQTQILLCPQEIQSFVR